MTKAIPVGQPVGRCVAGFAVRTQLTGMNIRVTIPALVRGIPKLMDFQKAFARVTIPAIQGLVGILQRESGAVVIESRKRQLGPSGIGMTRNTGKIQSGDLREPVWCLH